MKTFLQKLLQIFLATTGFVSLVGFFISLGPESKTIELSYFDFNKMQHNEVTFQQSATRKIPVIEAEINEIDSIIRKKNIQLKKSVTGLKQFNISPVQLAHDLNLKNKKVIIPKLKRKYTDDYEINNNEGFFIGKMDVKSEIKIVSWAKTYRPIKIEETTSREVIAQNIAPVKETLIEETEELKDNVRLTSSAVKKDIELNNDVVALENKLVSSNENKIVDKEVIKQGDEIEYYDYSESGNLAQKKKVSSRVSRVIQREMNFEVGEKIAYSGQGNLGVTNFKKPSKQNDYSNRSKGSGYSNSAEDQKGDYSELYSQKSSEDHSVLRLTAQGVFLQGKNVSKLQNYQLNFENDYNNVVHDEFGAVKVERIINNSISINGSLNKSEYIPTRINIPLTEDYTEIYIPMFNEEAFYKFLDENKLDGGGGHVLVYLSDSIEALDLGDTSYEKLFYFDPQFKMVSSIQDATFAMFIGVEAKNLLISYKLSTGNVVDKIVSLRENEVLYDEAIVSSPNLAHVELLLDSVLGSKKEVLDINEEGLSYFGERVEFKSLSLGHYQFRRPFSPLGNREYLTARYLRDEIFFGKNKNIKSVKLPTDDFYSYILDLFNIDQLQYGCLIQVNLEKTPIDFLYGTRSPKGPIAFEILYLDEFGKIVDELNPHVKKVFLYGDIQGAVNFKFEYEDQTVDEIESYCSDKIYLVEQL